MYPCLFHFHRMLDCLILYPLYAALQSALLFLCAQSGLIQLFIDNLHLENQGHRLQPLDILIGTVVKLFHRMTISTRVGSVALRILVAIL